MKISAVVNTLNEEKNIAACLDTLGWVDEIIVVDMESDDKTKELAYRYTKQIFNHPRVGFVEPARNFAISKATGDWILIVDADERVIQSLAARLIDITKEDKYDFVRIPRKNIIFGHFMQHSRWWPDHNIRFFKRGAVEWDDHIHSIPITTGEGLTLPDDPALALEHYHYDSLSTYLEKMLRYSKIQSDQLIADGYQFSWPDLVFKPAGEFFSRFFAGFGYQDGLHGLALSGLQAFSEFLVFLQVWEKQGFKRHYGNNFQRQLRVVFMRLSRDFHYWFMTYQLDQTKGKLKRFFIKLRRRLHI